MLRPTLHPGDEFRGLFVLANRRSNSELQHGDTVRQHCANFFPYARNPTPEKTRVYLRPQPLLLIRQAYNYPRLSQCTISILDTNHFFHPHAKRESTGN